ncbi:MAG: molecular chaperone DnaJ [Rhodobacteraceae bacterium]|jgi:molecular chaperone DnaJ|nr:molecular chaperone DnaJ [Paracoccaceae bacterium]
MAKRDYYEVLGTARGASAEDIKKAYRRKAKELHPDRNAGQDASDEAFKEVNEAYEALKDPQKRAAYDRFGHAAFDGGLGGGRPGGFGGQRGDFASAFSDVFEDLFGDFMGGGRGGAQRARRGSDLRYNLTVTLEEAFNGVKRTVQVPGSAPCEVCDGTGAAGGAEPVTCPTCAGMGKVRAQQGFFTVERTCPSCGGQGRIIKNPCSACGGQGRVARDRSLSVNVPAGVETGTRIRLAGEGEAGLRGGPLGDLYIFVDVREHPIFARDGQTLFCAVPVSVVTAALGGEIEVPTIDGGRARVRIPAGSQSGRQMRLKAKGMPAIRSSQSGDMIIELSVETPVNLTARQKELLREFEKLGEGNHPHGSSFLDKVKSFWESMKG